MQTKKVFVIGILFSLIFLVSYIPLSVATTGWSKTYAGNAYPFGSMIQTSDGGFALTGRDVGSTNAWIAKTDSSGNMQWNQTYGKGSTSDSIIQTNDGGYVIAGYSVSNSNGYLAWLAKTDSSGNMQWNQTFNAAALAYSVVQTSDGGYAIATQDFSANAFCLIKTDSSGNTQWTKSYGTAYESAKQVVANVPYDMIQTSNDGYVLVGQGEPQDKSVLLPDMWVVKTDSSGNMQWNSTFGGMKDDEAFSVIETSDKGFAVAGYTGSYGSGGADGWLIKIDASGNVQWNRTYGGTGDDIIKSVVQTEGNGFALAGSTTAYGSGGQDFWLIKTDSSGNVQWNQTYGGTKEDGAFSVVQTSDGGYAVAGYTNSYGDTKDIFWLVKTDGNGVLPEFPSFIAVLFLIIFTTAISILASRKKSNWLSPYLK